MSKGQGGVHNIVQVSETDTAFTWQQAKENSADTVMVVDAFATWCGPCKTIAPTLVKYAQIRGQCEFRANPGSLRFSDKYTDANFYKLDVDEHPEIAQELEIRAMPTFVLFVKGEKQPPIVGANPKALEEAIAQALEKLNA